jgi:hypothetical protein
MLDASEFFGVSTKTGKMPMDSPLIFVLGSFTVVAIGLFMIFRSK